MQILVALKWVALRAEIDPLTGAASVDSRFAGAGPADLSALEWALRLTHDSGSGAVAVVTVGPPEAEAMLRQALAAGAERAVRITGVPADAPSRWVAAELASVAAGAGVNGNGTAAASRSDGEGPCDLVVCGDASLDRGSGSVPAFVAHELGWPQALGLTRVQGPGPDRPGLTVERRLDRAWRERLRVEGPGVLSFEAGPELRRAPLASTLAASAALVETVPARNRGPAPVVGPVATVGHHPFRPRPRVTAPPRGSTRQRLDDLIGAGEASGRATPQHLTPADAARLTVERLAEWGYLADDGAC